MILGAAAGRGPSPLRLFAACLALGCVVAGLHLLRPALVARADLAVYDRLLTAAPRRAASDRVALVVVDERSLGEAGRWPWPRDRVAGLLDRVRALGAAAIGLDILFAEPDSGGDAPRDAGQAPGLGPGRDARGARARALRHRLRLHVRPARRPPVPPALDRPGARRRRGRPGPGAASVGSPVQPRPARGGGRLVRLHERVAGRGRDSPAHAPDHRARRRDVPEPRARHRSHGPRRAAARDRGLDGGVAGSLARRSRDSPRRRRERARALPRSGGDLPALLGRRRAAGPGAGRRARGPDRVRGRGRPRAWRRGCDAARHVPPRRRGPRDRGRQPPPG